MVDSSLFRRWRRPPPLQCAGLILLVSCFAEAQPVAPARMCAEWEPAVGTLIRWPLGIPSTLAVELASDDSLYVLVETESQENQARATFGSWGVNLDHCRFIYANTYSHWTRDWGPHSVFDGAGEWGIVDPVFTGYPWVPGCNNLTRGCGDFQESPRQGMRGYEEDDGVNAVLAGVFGCGNFELPAFLTGGNVMVDGHGTAFSTQQMLDENAIWWTEVQFRALASNYLGVFTYHFVSNPDINGLQHVDCWAKLLDEETILVKELPSWHPEYTCIEEVVDELAALVSPYGRPYRIVRVFCASYSGNSTAAYTNSLILNRKVLVPLFGISSDAQALETYRGAMPGYEVIGFPWSAWYYYDALHCRTMGIFDRHMLRIWHRPLGEEIFEAPDYPLTAMIDDRSEEGLIPDSLKVYWRVDEGPWSWIPLMSAAGPDSFVAAIPGRPIGSTIDYFMAAADSSGRRETLPRTVPEGFFRFTVAPSLDDVNVTFQEAGIVLSWVPVAGATGYLVYSSSDAYHGFAVDESGVLNATTWVAPVPEAPRFYRVTAVAP
ncbi:agmatine deiminase family protein [Candidatus Fermentibacteria bacterium]|nr:agmatine deiminase family protein [Candidatus Fermentibacteria bacterium]